MVNMQEQINGKQAAGESAAAEAVSAQLKRPDVQRITQTDTQNNRTAIGKEQKERELLREEEENIESGREGGREMKDFFGLGQRVQSMPCFMPSVCTGIRQVSLTLFSSQEPSGFIAFV